MISNPAERISIRRLLLAGGLVLLCVLIQRAAWRDIAGIAWGDEESSHILLVPVVAAWLIWVRRLRFRDCRGELSLMGSAITVAGAGLSYYGVGHGIQLFWHAGSLLMAVGCFVTVAGADILKQFGPVFLVLLFLVPVPATMRIAMSLPLERICASSVQQVMAILGFAVTRSGNLLSINGVDVTVAEACNGLRMVFGLILVATAFIFGWPMRWYVRLLVMVISPVLAVGLNILRLVPTLMMFGYTSHPTAEFFHDASGWAMLPLAFGLLVAGIRGIRWLALPVMRFELAVA